MADPNKNYINHGWLNPNTHKKEGYLVKLGTDAPIPLKYIKYETFQCLWSTTDVDSYRDASGTLHRDSVLPNKVLKVEWETPDLSDTEFENLMSLIRSQYLTSSSVGNTSLFNGKQAKSCNVKAWMPEEGDYKEDVCYLTADVNITVRYADKEGLRYNPVRFAFIGYSKPTAT